MNPSCPETHIWCLQQCAQSKQNNTVNNICIVMWQKQCISTNILKSYTRLGRNGSNLFKEK